MMDTNETLVVRRYTLTAKERGPEPTEYTLTALVLPTGEVIVCEPDTPSEVFSSLEEVSWEEVSIIKTELEEVFQLSEHDLASLLRRLANNFTALQIDPVRLIPATLHKYLTLYYVERWDGDCWDAITEHDTFTAAMREMDYYRDMAQLRVVEVEIDGSRQTVYWPCRY